ncbi:MAG: replication-associated recombination protein A, partial [Candidatus Moranbacteria bacterium]|nr:replication-associated recombination protein A [Candidatus Moranbacteria bacterium]
FWGPPGTGKTTLAGIIAKQTQAEFLKLSAVSSGKKDLLAIIKKAVENTKNKQKTILFLDEIHRWNKAQQDALLPCVEKGEIILIGATTENPSFEVNSALISRTRVLVLGKLKAKDLAEILQKALRKALVKKGPQVKPEIIKMIATLSNGDARMALNTLEACLSQNKKITPELVKEVLQKSHLYYDKDGEEHYNIISALHKSMRGGDAHASVYWLVRMLEGGEDPLYIARRLIRFASEDVGLADNHALVLANNVFETCHKIGMPECNVHLAQCVIYLAKTKKSILAYEAYNQAKRDVKNLGNLPVPLQIRNAPTKLMKNLGYGKNYKYTPKGDSSRQQYLPDKLKQRKYF